jgi:hypothetical protein
MGRAVAWKLYYLTLESEWTFRALAAVLSLTARLRGGTAAMAILNALAARTVWSGWPRRAKGWINVSASALYWRLRRRLEPSKGRLAPRPATQGIHALRVGCFGPFSGLLSFPPAFFSSTPPSVELAVYDVQYREAFATYARETVLHYCPVIPDPNGAWLDETAESINRARLDVLLNMGSKADAYGLLDRIDTPCIVNICTGSDLLHHDRVSFHLHAQPQVDCFPVDHAMRSAVTGKAFDGHRVYAGWILYDPRDIDQDEPPRSWSDRRPLIVVHGSLYKADSPEFLETVFGLLIDDPALEVVIVGKDTGRSLRSIMDRARGANVAGRVHYQGAFDYTRGGTHDSARHDGWLALREVLGAARLAPNPWPVGGGSSRFEAYAASVPSIHMALHTGRDAWKHNRGSVVGIPALDVPLGLAHSREQYRELCRRVLYDGSFADQLACRQRGVARRLSDPIAYWQQLLDCYADWLQSAPRD